MSQKDRIKTIIALLNSNPATSAGSFATLKAEFEQVLHVDAITPMSRKNLIKVLHSTRALDSTLQAVVGHHTLGPIHSLGPLIDKFYSHTNPVLGRMYQSECTRYKRSIADMRNKHLHTAGSYPRNEGEVTNLVSEMQSLIMRVLSL